MDVVVQQPPYYNTGPNTEDKTTTEHLQENRMEAHTLRVVCEDVVFDSVKEGLINKRPQTQRTGPVFWRMM